MTRQQCHDALRYLILNSEDVVEWSVVTLRPQVAAGRTLHELGRDSYPLAGSLQAALEDVPNAKLACDLPDIGGLVFVGEGRVSCDDEQLAKARQVSDDVFGDAIGQAFVALLSRQVVERQDRDRRLVRKARSSPWGNPLAEAYPVGFDRLADVLTAVRTDRLEGEGKLVLT